MATVQRENLWKWSPDCETADSPNVCDSTVSSEPAVDSVQKLISKYYFSIRLLIASTACFLVFLLAWNDTSNPFTMTDIIKEKLLLYTTSGSKKGKYNITQKRRIFLVFIDSRLSISHPPHCILLFQLLSFHYTYFSQNLGGVFEAMPH